MSDDTSDDPTDSIDTLNDPRVDIDVARDPSAARTLVTGITVSGSEKVSTGDYENFEPHISIRTEVRPAVDITTDSGLDHIRHQVDGLAAQLQERLDDAIDRRMSVVNGDPPSPADHPGNDDSDT